MVIHNSLIQYCQDFYMATFADKEISKYQINNAKYTLENANLNPVDYIGMSDDSAIMYNDIDDITLYIALDNNLKSVINTVDSFKEKNEELLFNETNEYWNNYIEKLNTNIGANRERQIIERSAYLFALLSNKETGGVIASPDVDENFTKCGRYGYCWPRDAIFIMKALALLGLNKNVDNFYNIWAQKAQLDNGLYEQRYYVNGELAPSWGVQIDETASMLIGIYNYGKCRKLENIIVKATNALIDSLDDTFKSKECFDLWEETKGCHLYTTASIYDALLKSRKMLLKIGKSKNKQLINNIEKILPKIQSVIRKDFVKDGIFIRRIGNTQVDISLLCLVTPFDIFDNSNPIVKNTVQEIEKVLKAPNGGYFRYQWDNYIGGNAWIIASLWLAMYYIKAGDRNKAQELFSWVTNHADNMSFLPEQIEREGHKTAWICSLAWSHAMYVIVANELKD